MEQAHLIKVTWHNPLHRTTGINIVHVHVPVTQSDADNLSWTFNVSLKSVLITLCNLWLRLLTCLFSTRRTLFTFPFLMSTFKCSYELPCWYLLQINILTTTIWQQVDFNMPCVLSILDRKHLRACEITLYVLTL